MSIRVRSLFLIILAEILAMTLWFSATAIVPALKAEVVLSDLAVSLLTTAVQIGFVAGTLTSAMLGLADRFDGRRLFALGAFVAATANLAILIVPADGWSIVLLRFLTGMCMAFVYPVGMRLATAWAKADMGLLVGMLVGALTLGSAAPHLFFAAGELDWRLTLQLGSGAAFLGGLLMFAVVEGPATRRVAAFHISQVLRYWTHKPTRFANFGYLGHMWELYACWAWLTVFLGVAFVEPFGEAAKLRAAEVTFLAIGAGAVGAVLAGFAADRYGRTLVAGACMVVSGFCALIVGFLFHGPVELLVVVVLIWGLTIVADSAQFSASVAELSEPENVGTMLTLQTSVGFLLTLASIHLVPEVAATSGWQWAFLPLAIGPVFGVWAMVKLRAMPEASRLAGGRG